MRKTKEILRQKWALERSHRAVAKSVSVSAGAVHGAVARAKAAGLASWKDVEPLDETKLDALMCGASFHGEARPEPDCQWIHRERPRTGVTLLLLHDEYRQLHPDGFGYTAFCDRYRDWLARRGLVMRQVHVAGDAMFVDYSGKRPSVVDPRTGEVTEVELFVAVLGASNYTYAEATRSQRGPDWIASHVRALAFFGGVPRAIVTAVEQEQRLDPPPGPCRQLLATGAARLRTQQLPVCILEPKPVEPSLRFASCMILSTC